MPRQDERWPTIYDFDELARAIQQLVRSEDFSARFYEPGRPRQDFCQGDVVTFRAEFPYLDEDGTPAAEESIDHWVILGNTCDLDREVGEVPWAQLIPVWDVASVDELGPGEVARFTSYRGYRQFYLPPWAEAVAQRHHVADFTRPVTIRRQGLSKATVVARLKFEGWVLFHCCLVRFLARDDRRNEPSLAQAT